MVPMSGYLVTRWACLIQATDPLRGTSAVPPRQIPLLLEFLTEGGVLQAMRKARLSLTLCPHFGHFTSMMPVAGVTLSRIRQPQTGHFFVTSNSLFFISFTVVLHKNVNQAVRVP